MNFLKVFLFSLLLVCCNAESKSIETSTTSQKKPRTIVVKGFVKNFVVFPVVKKVLRDFDPINNDFLFNISGVNVALNVSLTGVTSMEPTGDMTFSKNNNLLNVTMSVPIRIAEVKAQAYYSLSTTPAFGPPIESRVNVVIKNITGELVARVRLPFVDIEDAKLTLHDIGNFEVKLLGERRNGMQIVPSSLISGILRLISGNHYRDVHAAVNTAYPNSLEELDRSAKRDFMFFANVILDKAIHIQLHANQNKKKKSPFSGITAYFKKVQDFYKTFVNITLS